MESVKIQSVEVMQAINRVEIDMQVSTAKQYPRDIGKALSNIETLAMLDSETSEGCFYALKRGDDEKGTFIQGVSIRMAEIIASCWGNLRIQTRIIGNDGKVITAQGSCHDLENNVAISVEVQRRITYTNGNTYSEDMQVVTGNAASAIAFRNAVLKVIPKAATQKVVTKVHARALSECTDVEMSRQGIIQYFAQLQVTTEMLFKYLKVKKITDIKKDDIFILRALKTSIQEGSTTAAQAFKFKPTVKEKKEKMQKNANEPETLP